MCTILYKSVHSVGHHGAPSRLVAVLSTHVMRHAHPVSRLSRTGVERHASLPCLTSTTFDFYHLACCSSAVVQRAEEEERSLIGVRAMIHCTRACLAPSAAMGARAFRRAQS